jgi:hypothetical protein
MGVGDCERSFLGSASARPGAVGLARIPMSASRSLAVKLLPRCSRLGRLVRDDIRDEPEPRRGRGGAAAGDEGVMVIAAGTTGASRIGGDSSPELMLENVVVTSSEVDRVRAPRGPCFELFCRVVDNLNALPIWSDSVLSSSPSPRKSIESILLSPGRWILSFLGSFRPSGD